MADNFRASESTSAGAKTMRTIQIGGIDYPVYILSDLDGNPISETVRVPVGDKFSTGELLADQTGAGGVLTFTFTSEVDLVWIRPVGGVVRVDPFGGTPTASLGINVIDLEPYPITMTLTTMKVFAPSAVVVSVWGFRY